LRFLLIIPTCREHLRLAVRYWAMDEPPKPPGQSRLRSRWLLGTLAVAAVLAALLIGAMTWINDGDHLRAPLRRYFRSQTGRDIRIDGSLEVSLFSSHPTLQASRVTIGNPPWSAPGNFAEVESLTAVLDWPFGQRITLESLELHGAKLHFQRDVAGHANWHWHAPGIFAGFGLPILHSLSAPDAHVDLHDERRHLDFDGTLTTRHTKPDDPLRLNATGRLNGRDVTLTIDGEPLAKVAPGKPFHFTFDERSSGSRLAGHGTIPQPFDFRWLDVDLQASGKNLKDLYFLAGVYLPDTGQYQLSGKLQRRNLTFKLIDLVAVSGKSDARCNLTSVLNNAGRAHVDIDLESNVLRLEDLGVRTTGAEATDHRPPEPTSAEPSSPEKAPSLPGTPLNFAGLRRADYAVSLNIKRLDTRRLSFTTVAGNMTIDHGNITVPRLSGRLEDGKLDARIKLDAKTDTPTVNIDLTVTNLQLGRLPRKDPSQPPPLEGLLQGRADLKGHGKSVRDLAASASGRVRAMIPQGAIRASLAEITGMDFRGLGLMLTKNKQDTAIRCGFADGQVNEGTLTAQTLVLDTDPVLITGGGTLELASETLDLELEGHPKGLRVLRLSAPISVRGPVNHPSFALKKGQRKFKLIDPGHAQDVDCGALFTSDSRRP